MHYIINNSSPRVYDAKASWSYSPAENSKYDAMNDYAQKVQQGVLEKKSCQFPVPVGILEAIRASCCNAQNTQKTVCSGNQGALVNIPPFEDTIPSLEEQMISSETSKKIAEEVEISKKIAEAVEKLKTLLTQDNQDAILEHFAEMQYDFFNYRVIFYPKKTTPLRVVKSKQVMKELVTPNVISGKNFIESILKINGLELENKVKLIQQLLLLQYLFNKKENKEFIKGCADLNEIIKKQINSMEDDLCKYENKSEKYNIRFYIASCLLKSRGVSGYNAKSLIDLSVTALKYYDDKVSISDEEFINLNNFYCGIFKKQAFFIKEIRNMVMPFIKQFLNTYSNQLSTTEKAKWRECLTKALNYKSGTSILTKEIIKKDLLPFVSYDAFPKESLNTESNVSMTNQHATTSQNNGRLAQKNQLENNDTIEVVEESFKINFRKRQHDTISDVVQNTKKAAYSNNGNVPIKSILPVEGNASTTNQHATTSPNNENLVQEKHDIDAYGKEIIKDLEDFPNIFGF